MKNIVVFASGSGTNFQSLIDAAESGQIPARIRGLVASRKDAKALERAQKHHIASKVLAPSDFPSAARYEDALLSLLKNWNTDLIVLAGYLLKIPKSVIDHYPGLILNIHPSLLPKYGGKGFYGMNVHRAVIENNEKESGCTVHIVTEEYDKGPVVARKIVPVHSSDSPESLSRRILEQEHKLLPQAVADFIKTLKPKPT